MINFKYALNQDLLECKTSRWNGLECIFINGQKVSQKRNFKGYSEHQIQLSEGSSCKLQLITDPSTETLVCRIYLQNQHIISLKQSKNDHFLGLSLRHLQSSAIAGTVITSLLLVFAL